VYGRFRNDDPLMIKTYVAGLLVGPHASTTSRESGSAASGVSENGRVILDTVIGLGEDTAGVDVRHDEREYATVWPTRRR
jgi:hypothetical protein